MANRRLIGTDGVPSSPWVGGRSRTKTKSYPTKAGDVQHPLHLVVRYLAGVARGPYAWHDEHGPDHRCGDVP